MEIIKQGNYTYHLDDSNRVIKAEGFLTIERAVRNNNNQRKSGDEFRLEDDHGGHLFGAMFGGLSEDYNLVPMNDKVNIRDFKGLEREWRNEVDNGNYVFVSFDVAYESDVSKRPSALMVEHTINGESRDVNSFGNINQMLYDDNPEYNESESIEYAIDKQRQNDKQENTSINKELVNDNKNEKVNNTELINMNELTDDFNQDNHESKDIKNNKENNEYLESNNTDKYIDLNSSPAERSNTNNTEIDQQDIDTNKINNIQGMGQGL